MTAAADAEPVASQTEQLVARLRTAILELDLAPGAVLTERGLETAFAASRTPVRSALTTLFAEGLVQREGRNGRGWIVAPIDVDQIRELAELREAVETAAVRLAVARASAARIDALGELLAGAAPAGPDGPAAPGGLAASSASSLPSSAATVPAGPGRAPTPGTSSAAPVSAEAGAPAASSPSSTLSSVAAESAGVRAGHDFHVSLAALSGNTLMTESVRDAMNRLARTRFLEVRTPESRAHAWAEHRAVLDAVAARDADLAARLVGEHIRATNERLVAFLTAERRRLRGHGLSIVDTGSR